LPNPPSGQDIRESDHANFVQGRLRQRAVKEIASITGHKSLAMIEKYTRDADQERLSGAAIIAWENASRTKNGKPR
jgi:hypothetical protein